MAAQPEQETPAEARARILRQAKDHWLNMSKPTQELSTYSSNASAAESQFIVNGGYTMQANGLTIRSL